MDGLDVMAERVAPYHYTAWGLDYVWLTNGFGRTTTEYGDAVRIYNQDGLHKVIADSIITGPQRIRGAEVRFLRAMLGLSQEGLADLLDSSRPSVARWEANPNKAIEAATQEGRRRGEGERGRGEERGSGRSERRRGRDEAKEVMRGGGVEQQQTGQRDGARMCG